LPSIKRTVREGLESRSTKLAFGTAGGTAFTFPETFSLTFFEASDKNLQKDNAIVIAKAGTYGHQLQFVASSGSYRLLFYDLASRHAICVNST